MIDQAEFCDLCGEYGSDWGVTVYGEYEVTDASVCGSCLCKLERPQETSGCTYCDCDTTPELSFIKIYDEIEAAICSACLELAQDGAEIPRSERAKARAEAWEVHVSLLCEECLDDRGLLRLNRVDKNQCVNCGDLA